MTDVNVLPKLSSKLFKFCIYVFHMKLIELLSLPNSIVDLGETNEEEKNRQSRV